MHCSLSIQQIRKHRGDEDSGNGRTEFGQAPMLALTEWLSGKGRGGVLHRRP